MANDVIKMKSSLFALVAIFLGGLCVMFVSANPTTKTDLKAKLEAMDRLLSQKLLGDRAVLSQQSSSLDKKGKVRMSMKQLRKAKVQTPRDAIVETEDDRTALNQLFARLMKSDKARKQDMSDEDKAKVANIFSTIKQRFATLGNKLKGGFNRFESKAKNFFQGKG